MIQKLVAAEGPGLACPSSNSCFANCPVSGGGTGDTDAFIQSVMNSQPDEVYLTSNGSLDGHICKDLMQKLPGSTFRLLGEVLPEADILNNLDILELSLGATNQNQWLQLAQKARNAFDGVLLLSILGNNIPDWTKQLVDGVILRPIRKLGNPKQASFHVFTPQGNVCMISAYQGMGKGKKPDLLINSFGQKVDYFGAF